MTPSLLQPFSSLSLSTLSLLSLSLSLTHKHSHTRKKKELGKPKKEDKLFFPLSFPLYLGRHSRVAIFQSLKYKNIISHPLYNSFHSPL
ncbi:hypothetical protein ABFX02_02G020000 [Erythranthe guttata]